MPTASRYAASTDVSAEKSEMDIKRVLRQHGADTVATVETSGRAQVLFEMKGRRIVFALELPDRRSPEFTHQPVRGGRRSATAAEAVYEQAVRQRWRALHLVIRARLEAIEAGIETFEEAFLAHIQLPSGETVGQATAPAIAAAYAGEPMPALLPGRSDG
jgi:hypothetical protein